MKITTENDTKQFLLKNINNVYIIFGDNKEIKLNNIIDYDMDLDIIESSIIGFTNLLLDTEIENRFKRNKNNLINMIHIEATGIVLDDCSEIDVFYDIPCDMTIRRLRVNTSTSSCGQMFIELEGEIK